MQVATLYGLGLRWATPLLDLRVLQTGNRLWALCLMVRGPVDEICLPVRVRFRDACLPPGQARGTTRVPSLVRQCCWRGGLVPVGAGLQRVLAKLHHQRCLNELRATLRLLGAAALELSQVLLAPHLGLLSLQAALGSSQGRTARRGHCH